MIPWQRPVSSYCIKKRTNEPTVYVTDLAGLNAVVIKQVEEFFVNYPRARKVTSLGRHGPDRAREILR